jgi:hypothetical protein
MKFLTVLRDKPLIEWLLWTVLALTLLVFWNMLMMIGYFIVFAIIPAGPLVLFIILQELKKSSPEKVPARADRLLSGFILYAGLAMMLLPLLILVPMFFEEVMKMAGMGGGEGDSMGIELLFLPFLFGLLYTLAYVREYRETIPWKLKNLIVWPLFVWGTVLAATLVLMLVVSMARVDYPGAENIGAQHPAAAQRQSAPACMDTPLDADARDSSGNTPLHTAVFNNQKEIVACLIMYKADVNALNKLETPLHMTARLNSLDIAKMLVGEGADVNARDVSGRPVLHAAAAEGNEPLVKFLLDKGADPAAKDAAGRTYRDLMKERGQAAPPAP